MRFLDAATCPVEPESRAFTDAALAALRAEGWSRGGWAHFADQVARRSAQQVAAHPRAAAELTALHVGFALAGRGRGRRWVVISWLMAVTHLGLLGQRRSIGWANVLSLARASLVVTGEPLGRWVGVAALLSDKLDGTVARRTRPTMFGFYADSLADAAFWTWLGDPPRAEPVRAPGEPRRLGGARGGGDRGQPRPGRDGRKPTAGAPATGGRDAGRARRAYPAQQAVASRRPSDRADGANEGAGAPSSEGVVGA